MPQLNENFVIDARGKKIGVFLPIKDYNKLLEDLEDLDDLRTYDKAMNRKQEFIPLKLALKQIEISRKKKK